MVLQRKDLFPTEIQDAKYDKADLAEVIAKYDHLIISQQS
jgi:hypothetical protein